MSFQRHSKKRDAIYEMLSGTKAHPTAEWIYDQLKGSLPNLSLGTVYRNLAQFKEQGMAVCVATVNGQDRFDACTSPHSHFICRCCGAVQDVENAPLPPLPQVMGTIESCQLHYSGICASCAQKDASGEI